jgi:hypothetical protein
MGRIDDRLHELGIAPVLSAAEAEIAQSVRTTRRRR